jgi:hypothetical protein
LVMYMMAPPMTKINTINSTPRIFASRFISLNGLDGECRRESKQSLDMTA